MDGLSPYLNGAGRVLLALIFIMSGVGKIFAYAGTVGYMESAGVPGILLPVVIIVEIVGGLMVALGFQARLGALALAGFSLVSAVLFHRDFADQTQMIFFMKNLAMAGGLLMIVARGAGPMALDNRGK